MPRFRRRSLISSLSTITVTDIMLQNRQSIHRLPIRPRHQMPVNIHGDINARMPELLLDVGKQFPFLDEQRRECA
jgi:hypothetical protein